MTSYNGYIFTNLSSGDTLSDPDSFTNPSNAMDDNDSTTADLTTLSAGTEVTKTLGTTFASRTVTVIRIKSNTDMNLGSASYAGSVKLQAYNGSSWIDLLTLGTTTTQTLAIDTLVRGSFTCQGLRIAFISTVDSGNNIDMDLYTLSYGTSFTYTAKNLLENFKGGTNIEDLSDKTAISEDHTKTWQNMTQLAGVGQAEGAYRGLQSNNIATNGVHFVVDEFTDSTGTKNTVNITDTTAGYDDTNIIYILDTNTDVSGDTTNNSHTFTNEANAFNNDKTDYAEYTFTATVSQTNIDIYLGKTFTSKLIKNISYKVNFYNEDNDGQTIAGYLQTYNGSSWSTVKTFFSNTSITVDSTYEGVYQLDSTVEGVRIFFDGRCDDVGDIARLRVYKLSYGDYDSSSAVICDTNTKTLDGTEESITVFGDVVNTANTSVTIDITDGTTTLSAQPLNTVIGLDGFTSGTLTITFNLNTTVSTETPELSGYGSYIL